MYLGAVMLLVGNLDHELLSLSLDNFVLRFYYDLRFTERKTWCMKNLIKLENAFAVHAYFNIFFVRDLYILHFYFIKIYKEKLRNREKRK